MMTKRDGGTNTDKTETPRNTNILNTKNIHEWITKSKQDPKTQQTLNKEQGQTQSHRHPINTWTICSSDWLCWQIWRHWQNLRYFLYVFFYPNKSRLCCFSNYDRFPLVINNILNLCVWYLHFSDRISPLHCFLMSLVIRKHNPAAFAVFYFIFIKHLILRKMFFFSWIRPWLFLVFTDILRL